MTVKRIKKLFVIAHNSHRDAILEALQKMGAVQIEDLSTSLENEDKTAATPSRIGGNHWKNLRRGEEIILSELYGLEKSYNEVLYSIHFLEQYIPQRKGLDLLRQGPESVTLKEKRKILADFDHGRFILELQDLEAQIKKLHAKRLTLLNRREHLLPWENLQIPLNYFCRTEHTRIRALSVPVTKVDACRKAAEEAIGDLWTVKVAETKQSKHIIIIYHKNAEETAEKIMRDFDVHPAVFPCIPQTPQEEIREIDRELAELEQKTLELENRLKEMKPELLRLKVVANDLDNILERKKAFILCAETSSALISKGWIPEDRIKTLEQTLRSISPEVDISATDPLESEDVPIILENPSLLSPFEFVIDMFGKPNYHEYDPTPITALFFFIGFGYCLADAGYGLMMSLLFGWVLWKWKLTPGVRRFCKLMALSGISGILFGALTGSWFGNLLTGEELPTYKLGMAPLLFKLRKIDPLGRHVLLFLGAALGIGYFQLCLGMALKTLHLLRRHSYGDAFLDALPPFVFATGLVIVYFTPAAGIWISGGALLVLLLFAGRHAKNLLVRIGIGIWTIYGTVTGLLSDVLSYSRLFALGLASGIMATVINIIANILGTKIPLAGWLLALILLPLAHILNLAINVLGAFIHTARLQFVEFFPKFYQNGGHRFEPLMTKYKYLMVEQIKKE